MFLRTVSTPRAPFVRTYIARRVDKRKAERPPYRAPDPLIDNPTATVTALPEDGLTFIHRPPPTAPTPYSLSTAPASPLLRPPTESAANGTPALLPPSLRPSADQPQPQRVSDADMRRIRDLRLRNPAAYSRGKLAKMFSCAPHFVGSIVSVPKKQRLPLLQARDEAHAKIRERWSEKKIVAKAIKVKRKEFW